MVRAAWLIGSAAWGGFGLRSDIDVVLMGLAPERRSAVEARLEEGAGCHVDVLRWEELPDPFRNRILQDGVALDD